jgi:hypothetical protein
MDESAEISQGLGIPNREMGSRLRYQSLQQVMMPPEINIGLPP